MRAIWVLATEPPYIRAGFVQVKPTQISENKVMVDDEGTKTIMFPSQVY